MFAVGRQTGTHTRIVITGRRREDRRTVAAERENSREARIERPEVSIKAPPQRTVH